VVDLSATKSSPPIMSLVFAMKSVLIDIEYFFKTNSNGPTRFGTPLPGTPSLYVLEGQRS
jgi:hypothetical protein